VLQLLVHLLQLAGDLAAPLARLVIDHLLVDELGRLRLRGFRARRFPGTLGLELLLSRERGVLQLVI